MMSMSTQKKNKYQTYGAIYQHQCVNCFKEGTYHCKLEIEEEQCKNYETLQKGDLIFGGY